MKKIWRYVAGVWLTFGLISVPELQGMEQPLQGPIEGHEVGEPAVVFSDLVSKSEVEKFVSDFIEEGVYDRIRGWQLSKIKRKYKWDGDSNSENWKDPTMYSVKLVPTEKGEELAPSENECKEEKFVVKAVLDRGVIERLGSETLKAYLSTIDVDFCEKIRYPFEVYGFVKDKFELRFIPVCFGNFVCIDDSQSVFLELMWRGPSKTLWDCYLECFLNNVPDSLVKISSYGGIAGRTLKLLKKLKIAHGDSHLRNFLFSQENDGKVVVYVIDADRLATATKEEASFFADVDASIGRMMLYSYIGERTDFTNCGVCESVLRMEHRIRAKFSFITSFIQEYLDNNRENIMTLNNFEYCLRAGFCNTTNCLKYCLKEKAEAEYIRLVRLVCEFTLEMYNKFYQRCLYTKSDNNFSEDINEANRQYYFFEDIKELLESYDLDLADFASIFSY